MRIPSRGYEDHADLGTLLIPLAAHVSASLAEGKFLKGDRGLRESFLAALTIGRSKKRACRSKKNAGRSKKAGGFPSYHPRAEGGRRKVRCLSRAALPSHLWFSDNVARVKRPFYHPYGVPCRQTKVPSCPVVVLVLLLIRGSMPGGLLWSGRIHIVDLKKKLYSFLKPNDSGSR